MTSARPKPEDSADGCRAFASADREKAAGTLNEHVRATFERSAEAWTTRAELLDRLQASFDARTVAIQADDSAVVRKAAGSSGE